MNTSNFAFDPAVTDPLGTPSDPVDASTPAYFPSDQCTFETCGLDGSFFAYRPTKSVNLAFAILFGLSAIAFLLQGIASKKRWVGFTVVMVSGCVLEVVGYTGRVLAYNDLYSELPFFIQIICLTIAPAFLAAGIYLCLSHIVSVFGPENSRISPRFYPLIFVTCDFLSLVLQGAGGGIATMKTHEDEDPKLGNNIMIAGLSTQVVTLLVFILLALDLTVCTVFRIRQLSSHNALDPRHAELRKRWVFWGFLVALFLSTLCIFTRCIYRVAELSHGWTGQLLKKQNYFVGLEGAIIIVAVFMLNLFHPGLCLNDSMQPTLGTEGAGSRRWYERKRNETRGQSSIEAFSAREGEFKADGNGTQARA